MIRIALPLAALALLLAACSGSDAGDPQATQTLARTVAATPTLGTPAAPTASPPPTTATAASKATTGASASPTAETPAPTPATGATATATPPATAVPPTPTPAPQPRNVTVAVRDNLFVPSAITVAPGSTVTWVWEGVEFHNIVGAGFGVADTTKTGSYSFTFATAGSFAYVCQVHEESYPPMKGVVEVE